MKTFYGDILEVLALAVKSTGKIWTQKPAVRLWL